MLIIDDNLGVTCQKTVNGVETFQQSHIVLS